MIDPLTIVLFGTRMNSLATVRIRVESSPSSTTVPSVVPTRMKSPALNPRAYMSRRPLIACPTRPADPNVTRMPVSTEIPLNESEPAPGRKG